MDLKEEREVSTHTSIEPEIKTDSRLNDLPRLQDMMKSEQEVARAPVLDGLSDVEQKVSTEDRQFTRKADEKKAFYVKRFKTLTFVYCAVAVLMLTLIGFNVATLTMLNRDKNSLTRTTEEYSRQIALIEDNTSPEESVPLEIKLNEPRDYNDDEKELTFMDRLTILFKSIFG